MSALTSKFYLLDSGVEFNVKQSLEKALELLRQRSLLPWTTALLNKIQCHVHALLHHQDNELLRWEEELNSLSHVPPNSYVHLGRQRISLNAGNWGASIKRGIVFFQILLFKRNKKLFFNWVSEGNSKCLGDYYRTVSHVFWSWENPSRKVGTGQSDLWITKLSMTERPSWSVSVWSNQNK